MEDLLCLPEHTVVFEAVPQETKDVAKDGHARGHTTRLPGVIKEAAKGLDGPSQEKGAGEADKDLLQHGGEGQWAMQ